MGMGALVGYLMAKFIVSLIKRLELEYEGLYPVIMISLVLLTYIIAGFVKGNGFLAVYVAGLMLGRVEFPNKKMIKKFHDGIAWLMQILMFIALGLLVFPSEIIPLIGKGLLITILLMLVARPVSVFLSLMPFKMKFAKKTMISWVGLRGSVPIILATFPFTAGIPQAETIFNIVFFVVIASVFIQGTSIPIVSKFLKLDVPMKKKINYPIEFEKMAGMDVELTDVPIPYESDIIDKKIAELNIPAKCLIVLISRNGQFIVPSGSTIIESADVLLVLANEEDLMALQNIITPLK
jgi:cell volume regulation protein A